MVLKFFLILNFVATYATYCFALPQIRLNEIMASNSSTVADVNGDYNDWIEIYNYGYETVNLLGFGLSDDYENPHRWIFPNISLAPDEYLIVWASGKDRRFGELHSNFSISSSGEEVILTTPDGERIDKLSPINIPNGVSIGRVGSDNETWYYFDTPTPGEDNTTQSYLGITPKPQFSRHGGIFTDDFNLEIFAQNSNVKIFYTIDGSEPDSSNVNGSFYVYKKNYQYGPTDALGQFYQRYYRTHQYHNPISVENKTGRDNPIFQVNTRWVANPVIPRTPPLTGTVVRAIAVQEGYLPSEIVTHSYLVGENLRQRYHVPVIFLTIPEKRLFDYNTGIYVPGEDFDKWRLENPDEIPSGHTPGNYRRRGIETEIPTHIEFYNHFMEKEFSHMCGVRLHGGWSRSFAQKSFRLYARGQYGQAEFNYPFFSQKDTDSFHRMLLRNSGNDQDKTFFRDGFIQNVVKNLNFDVQYFEPSVVFLNGEYWGILNIRDRIDNYYLEYEHGVNPDNLDFLTLNARTKQGTNTHYINMLNTMKNGDMTDSATYHRVNTMMDVENYITYHATQVFIANTDWPHNNIDFWRVRTSSYNPDALYGHDGRWRWIFYDTDFAFVNSRVNRNSLENAADPEHKRPWSTELFRLLLENEKFRIDYINRSADLFNSVFRSDFMIGKIDSLQSHMQPLMAEHIAKWRAISSESRWNSNVDDLRRFAEGRAEHIRGHYIDFFNLSGYSNLAVSVGNGDGFIRVNSLELKGKSRWQGVYFNDVPIEIEAMASPGYFFSHWESDGELYSRSSVIEAVLNSDKNLRAYFIKYDVENIVHYWHFKNLPNRDVWSVISDYSKFDAGLIEYSGFGQGYMDRAEGTLLNSKKSVGRGYSLRVRNPTENRELVLNIPTTGFRDISLSYALMRTPNGSKTHSIYYTTNENSWQPYKKRVKAYEDYDVYKADFSSISAANNNPYFNVKFIFEDNIQSTSGNNRFDNIAVEGKFYENVQRTVNFSSNYENAKVSFNGNLIDDFSTPEKFNHGDFIILKPQLESSDKVFKKWIVNGADIYNELITLHMNKDYSVEAIFDDKNNQFNVTLLHYWNFNSFLNETNNYLPADYSFLKEKAHLFYPSETIDYLEGTNLNSKNQELPGYAIAFDISQNANFIILDVPTTDFTDILFSFAISKSVNGADFFSLYYSTQESAGSWRNFSSNIKLNTQYELKKFDFSQIDKAQDNPNFKIKIVFHNHQNFSNGHISIDNIAVEGIYVKSQMWDYLERKAEVSVGYPNPFKEKYSIAFNLEHSKSVSLKIYDISARLVETLHSGALNQGRHEFYWQPDENIKDGVYIYVLEFSNMVYREQFFYLR